MEGVRWREGRAGEARRKDKTSNTTKDTSCEERKNQHFFIIIHRGDSHMDQIFARTDITQDSPPSSEPSRLRNSSQWTNQ